MPKIPTYEQQSTPQGVLIAPEPQRSAAVGLGVLTSNLRQTAYSLQAVKDSDQRKAEADSIAEMNLVLAKGDAEWDQHFQERTQAEDATPDGFTPRILADFDKWAGEARGAAKTERARQLADLSITQMRGRLSQASLRWETEKGIEQRGIKYSTSVDYQRKVLRSNPDQFDQVLEQQAVALREAGLPAATTERLWINTRDQLSASAVETLVERNPYQALKSLRAEPGKSGSTAIEALSADARDQAINAAEAEVRRREAEARARAAEARQSLSDQEADAFAAKASGLSASLPSRGAYVAAYGAAEGNRRYSQKAQMFGVFDVVNAAVLMPPSEAAATLSAYKPQQQAGAADQAQIQRAALGMYEQQRKAFEADPAAALVSRDPQLRGLFDAATAPDATPAQWQAYATRARAAQTAAGITDVRLLPAGMAEHVAGQLAFDPKQPEERTKRLQALQAQFGPLYPQILREVAPKLDGTARVLVGMSPEQGARLDAALAAGGKEGLGKVVPKDQTKQLGDALAGELRPLANTLRDNVDFESIYGQHYDAAMVLAMSLVARGESPRKAAQAAAAAVINDQFDYRGTVRVPKGQPTDAILAGADRAKFDAQASGTFRIAASSYSNDEQAQADLRAAIERGGYWVTNGDQSGLVLMVPTRRGASQVLNADGSPVAYTWAELTQKAADRGQVPGYINPQSPTYQYLYGKQ